MFECPRSPFKMVLEFPSTTCSVRGGAGAALSDVGTGAAAGAVVAAGAG